MQQIQNHWETLMDVSISTYVLEIIREYKEKT